MKPMGVEQKPVVAEVLAAHELEKPQDQCGVYGIYAPGEPVCYLTYYGLRDLQHRGQSGAGISYLNPDKIQPFLTHKDNGKVDEAIGIYVEPQPDGTSRADTISNSPLALGHTRYSTAASESQTAMHPHEGPYTGMVLVHNGDIELMSEIARGYGIEPGANDTDSSLLTQVIDKQNIQLGGDLEGALQEVLPQIEGAYCLVMSDGERIVCARDPWGTHPLALGQLPENKGWVVASESVVFNNKKLRAEYVRDIEPGEILSIGPAGLKSSRISRQEQVKNCLYEYIYISRPDSVINGISVYAARKNMGRHLAQDHPAEADVVVGVPHSGLVAAAGYAEVSGLPKVEGIFKNQYIGRTFIHRGQQRQSDLDEKFHPNSEELAGQRIVLVDDSLIKGSTMKTLIGMLREAGAREVHVRLAAPHYKYSCYGGMDTRETWRLIAREHSDEEIADLIGADSVRFNRLERTIEAIQNAQRDPMRRAASFCTACATGDYPYKVPTEVMVDLTSKSALPVVS